jgi:hypothetical protein
LPASITVSVQFLKIVSEEDILRFLDVAVHIHQEESVVESGEVNFLELIAKIKRKILWN